MQFLLLTTINGVQCGFQNHALDRGKLGRGDWLPDDSFSLSISARRRQAPDVAGPRCSGYFFLRSQVSPRL
jgi:hypothetical protein